MSEKEDQAMMQVVKDRWIEIGLCTDRINVEETKKAVDKFYKSLGKTTPTEYYVFPSPYAAMIGGAILEHCDDPNSPLKGLLSKDKLTEPELPEDKKAIFKETVRKHLQNMMFGFQAVWLSWYDYRETQGDTTKDTEQSLIDLAKHCGWWCPFEEVYVLQDRPKHIWRNANGQLHKDGAKAVEYMDGWGIHCLNGVLCPEWVVMTPGEQIDPIKVVQEQNVEIRRELLRKIGVERFVFKVGAKTLDKDGSYELLSVDLGLQEPTIALKMENASLPEVWHVEFVLNTCRTVQDALNFRNGLTPDMIDDVNGADWFEQGDVILKPRGAKKFKSRPTILT